MISFKNVKQSYQVAKPTLFTNSGGGLNSFAKKAMFEHPSDLQYKVMNCDYVVIHQLFDSNGFRHVPEGNEWNVLWTSKHSKNYSYEGLHEY
jgi:hypothetical protein